MKKGETYKGFKVTKALAIEELKSQLYELVHEESGAEVLAICNDDPEKLFCCSFQTYPENDQGIPHILEHEVLCGSTKFPIKDPFFSMHRRSMTTFMNAMTGSDFTCYPAASQIEKDYFNLFEVYLDAVFHPDLKKESFLQEGHRFEFDQGKLVYKGIVYNEMKGSLSSPVHRMWHRMLRELTPDLPYAFNSGGDPKEIPDLSHEELVAFHKFYYHPSHCLFFFYGDLPLEKNLDFIEKNTLSQVKKIADLPHLPEQKRFTQPKKVLDAFPTHETDDLENKGIFAIGFLTAPIRNQEDVLALTLLDSILMDTDASILKKELLGSKLCLQADSFLDNDMSEVPFLFLFKGCNEKNRDKLFDLVINTLRKIAEKKIPPHLIESSIHHLEMSRSEIGGNHSPFGLTLFMRSALMKQHGCPPENSLIIHELFSSLRKKIADPNYLSDLIKTYFIDNQHVVQLFMKPDPQLSFKEEEEEKAKLEKLQQKLTPEEVDEINLEAKELEAYQKACEKQSNECLPKISLSDVPKEPRNYPLKRERVNNLDVFHHQCFTNQLTYVDLYFDLPKVSADDLFYLKLLILLISEVGAKDRNYVANLEAIHASTGGIGASCSLHLQADDAGRMNPSILFHGKALDRNVHKLFPLLLDMIEAPRFDEKERIKEVLLQLATALQSSLNNNALKYAIGEALSSCSLGSRIANEWKGYPFYQKLQELTKNIDAELPSLIEKLLHLKEKLFTLNNPQLVLAGDEKVLTQIKRENYFGCADLAAGVPSPWSADLQLPFASSHGRPLALPVAFTAQAFAAVPYTDRDAPALQVASQLAENVVLHHHIREIGGAYGSGANYHSLNGSFCFHSYRDPHLRSTLEAIELSIQTLADGKFNEQDLEEAKLGILQHADAPIAPGVRAETAYTWLRSGQTFDVRTTFRTQLLNLTANQLSEAVAKHLLNKKSTIVSFAGKELLDREASFSILGS